MHLNLVYTDPSTKCRFRVVREQISELMLIDIDDANACPSDAYCGAPTTGRVAGRANCGTLGISGEVTAESGTVLVKERRARGEPEWSGRRGKVVLLVLVLL